LKWFIFFALCALSARAESWTVGPIADEAAWLSTLLNQGLRGVNRTPAAGDYHVHLEGVQGVRAKTETVDVLFHPPVLTGEGTIFISPPASPSDDSRAIFEQALCDARTMNATKPVRLVIGSGTYRIKPSSGTGRDCLGRQRAQRDASWWIDGLHDTVVRGQDSASPPTLIFEDPFVPGIQITNSVRVRVSDLILTYDYSATAHGQVYGGIGVRAHGLGGGQIQLENALPFPADLVGNVFAFNWAAPTPPGPAFFNAGDPPTALFTSFENTTKPTQSGMILSHSYFDRFLPNERLIVLHTRRTYDVAVHIDGTGNEDIGIVNLSIPTFPQMAIRAQGLRRGLLLKDNKVIPNPGALMGGRADGLHVAASGGDIIIEGNQLGRFADDALNLRGMDIQISGATYDSAVRSNSRLEWKEMNDVYLAPGDFLALATTGNRPFYVVQVDQADPVTRKFSLKNSCGASCWDAIEAQYPIAPARPLFGLAYNLSRSTSRWVVRNNMVTGNGGRGFLIQAPNGVLTQNTLSRIPSACLLLASENGTFFDGPGPSNVGVYQNTLRECGFRKDAERARDAALGIATPVASGETFPLLQKILVRGNRIESSPRAGISISRGRRIEASANCFYDDAQLNGYSNVESADSSLVFFENNHFSAIPCPAP